MVWFDWLAGVVVGWRILTLGFVLLWDCGFCLGLVWCLCYFCLGFLCVILILLFGLCWLMVLIVLVFAYRGAVWRLCGFA